MFHNIFSSHGDFIIRFNRVITILVVIVLGLGACTSQLSVPQSKVNDGILPFYVNPKHPLPIPGEGRWDKDGISMHDYQGTIGKQYNPLFIAGEALNYYIDYTCIPAGCQANPEYRIWFLKTANWLYNYAEKKDDTLLFPYKFYFRTEPPWYSAITQAAVAKVFVSAYKLSADEKWKTAAVASVKPIFKPLSENGFMYMENDLVIFEEYPKPSPNHVLNAQMSVILDLHSINSELQSAEIGSYIDKGIESTLKLLQSYEAPHLFSFAYAANVPPGEGIRDWSRKIRDADFLYKTPGYDMDHLRYLSDLGTLKHKEIFRRYFWKYLAYMELGKVFFKKTNVINPINGATIEGVSPFLGGKGYTFEDMVNNYYLITTIYARTEDQNKDKPVSFVVNLNGVKTIDEIYIQYNWDNYPTAFKIEKYSDGEWIVILMEEGWHPNGIKPVYNKNLISPVTAEKIRFSVDQFHGQKRLVIEAFIIKQAYSQELFASILTGLTQDGFFQTINPLELAKEYLEPVESGQSVSSRDEIWLRNYRLNEHIAKLASTYYIDPQDPRMMKAVLTGDMDYNELVSPRIMFYKTICQWWKDTLNYVFKTDF